MMPNRRGGREEKHICESRLVKTKLREVHTFLFDQALLRVEHGLRQPN